MNSVQQYRKLVSAIKEEDYLRVKELLTGKFDIECADIKGYTPLHWATELGTVNIAHLLVVYGAGVETENKYGLTPLSLASSQGDMELTTLYLEKGANPNGTNYLSIPIINAAGFGHHAIIALLVEHGADVNIMNENGDTPLIYAAMKGRLFTVKTLLERGADTEARTDAHIQDTANDLTHSGRTALHWAVQEEYPEIIQLLLEHGANVEAEDESGITPVSAAAANGETFIFELLLGQAVNIDGSATAQSPLVMAVAFQNHLIAELLISRGADINITGSDGDTVLIDATRNGDLHMMELLLDAGADTAIRNPEGATALDVATASKHKKTIALLKNYSKA